MCCYIKLQNILLKKFLMILYMCLLPIGVSFKWSKHIYLNDTPMGNNIQGSASQMAQAA